MGKQGVRISGRLVVLFTFYIACVGKEDEADWLMLKDHNANLPDVVVTEHPAEGTYIIHVTSDDFGTAEQRAIVTDKGPRRLLLRANGPLKVGQEVAIQISAVDRYDRLTDYGMENYPGGAVPDPLRVIGPDGAAVEVEPYIYDIGTVDLILQDGVGSFTFTPQAPGTYQVLIPWSPEYGQVDGYLEGTFEVSP